MRALANCTQTIERRHTNARREVAVGTTTNCDLFQGKAEIAGDSPGQFEQLMGDAMPLESEGRAWGQSNQQHRQIDLPPAKWA